MPMNLHRHIFAGSAIAYILNDDFTVAQSAPLTSPRPAEPGPGQLKITDTTNKVSISSGALQFSAGGGGSNDPSIWSNVSYARQVGLALIAKVTNSSFNGLSAGWSANNTGDSSPCGFTFNGGGGIRMDWSNSASFNGIALKDTWTIGSTYQFAIILRTGGAFFMIKGNPEYSNWTLFWIAGQQSTTPLYAKAYDVFASTSACALDYLRVLALGSPFSNDITGLATVNVASPTSLTNYTGEANAIIDMTITTATALDVCELRYRYQDANNYWTMYFDASGNFKVDSVVAGTPTNRVSVASVSVLGQTNTIRVICDGINHHFYTLNGTTWTARGSLVSVATPMDAATTVRPVKGANDTIANLVVMPRKSALYNGLNI